MAEVIPGKRILLVDDEEVIRLLAMDILEDAGYGVWAVENGEDALAYFAENWPDVDLVILDLFLPGLSGSELFYALRGINPSVRVLLFSGYEMDEPIQELVSRGGVEFLKKPISVRQLLDRVQLLLNS